MVGVVETSEESVGGTEASWGIFIGGVDVGVVEISDVSVGAGIISFGNFIERLVGILSL